MKQCVAVLFVFLLLAGCAQQGIGSSENVGESEPSIQQSIDEPESSLEPSSTPDEPELAPDPIALLLDMLSFAQDSTSDWTEVRGSWHLVPVTSGINWDRCDENNVFQAAPKAGSVREDNPLGSWEITITNPKTNLVLDVQVDFSTDTEYGDAEFGYTIGLGDHIIHEEPMRSTVYSGGPAFPRWVDERHFLFKTTVYNIEDWSSIPLVYPTDTVLTDGETGTEYGISPYASASYINNQLYVVPILSSIKDYAKYNGEGMLQTLYFCNWETGESFAFFENQYLPAGAEIPENRTIQYMYDKQEGKLYFIVRNIHNIAGLGDDIAYAGYILDVASETVTDWFVLADNTSIYVHGDYIRFVAVGTANDAVLYHWNTNRILCAGSIVPIAYMPGYFLLETDDAYAILHPETKTQYVLSKNEFAEQFPQGEFSYGCLLENDSYRYFSTHQAPYWVNQGVYYQLDAEAYRQQQTQQEA